MHDQSTPRNEGGQNPSHKATPQTDSRYPPRPCAHCGTPFTSRDKRQRFCSRPCVWAAARAKLASMQVEGEDPTHGGKAAEARRASLARRRAAGEPLGRAAHNAKKGGTLPERPFTPRTAYREVPCLCGVGTAATVELREPGRPVPGRPRENTHQCAQALAHISIGAAVQK